MHAPKTQIFKEAPSVNRRVLALGLDKEGLLDVRTRALSSAAHATPFHPANAGGQFAYLEGVRSLREVFVGQGWEPGSVDGMEFIVNHDLRLRIGFSNVKVACNDDVEPRARSPRGAAAERVCSHTMDMFADHFAPVATIKDDYSTYFLMVDTVGAVELTCPTIENGNYREYLERIYLSDGSDLTNTPVPLDDEDDSASDEFDPVVARR